MRTLRRREVKTLVQVNTVSGRAGIWTSSLTPWKMLLASTKQHPGFTVHSILVKGDQGLVKTAALRRCSRNVRPVSEWINKEWKSESNLKCHLCEWRKEVALWGFSTKGTTQLSSGTHWRGSHRGPEEIDEEVCAEVYFAGELGILSLGFQMLRMFLSFLSHLVVAEAEGSLVVGGTRTSGHLAFPWTCCGTWYGSIRYKSEPFSDGESDLFASLRY